MHNYNEALDIITQQLEIEENKNNIDILKKNKDICLNGLYDWEQLLSSNEENNNINLNNSKNVEIYNAIEDNHINLQEKLANEINPNKIIENYSNGEENEKKDNYIINTSNNDINKNNESNNENKLKEDIEKEILLSKACMNLGEWNQLKEHFSNLNKLIKSSNALD